MFDKLLFDPPVPMPLIVGLGLGLLGITIFTYLTSAKGVGRWRRGLLVLIRAAFVAGLLVVLMRPMDYRPRDEIKEKPVFCVMADCSQSMNTRDVGEASRFEVMRGGLLEHEGLFHRDLPETCQVRFYRFADKLQRSSLRDLSGQEKAKGRETHLADCLLNAMQTTGGKKLAGILLLSDGRENDGAAAANVHGIARRLRAANVPLWTVPLGTTTGTRDVYLTARLSTNFLFINQPASIQAEVTGTGYSNWIARVNLYREDEYVTSQQAQLRNGHARVQFPIEEETKGSYRYRVEVEPMAGESNPENNRRALFARVVDERSRVLVIEARPSWDSKFLLRALRDDFNVEVTSIFHINSRKTFAIVEKISDTNASKEVMPGVRMPRTREELFKYDCIFLGRDIDAVFSAEELRLLRDYLVERGGSVVFFRGRAYAGENPLLANLEPMEWGDAFLTQARFELTAQGRVNPVFNYQPHPKETDVIIRELPEMISVARVRNEKTHAVVLARCGGADSSTAPLAAIAYQRYGKGKVMSIGAGGLWRWAFLPEELRDYDDIYRRFWSQMIRWLIADSDFLPGQEVSLQVDKNNFTPEEAVRLAVHTQFVDPGVFEPQIEVTRPDGQKIRLRPEREETNPQRWQTMYMPEAEGEYTAVLHSKVGEPKEQTVRFTVYNDSLELRYVSADREVMEQLSDITRGECLGLDDLDTLPAKVKEFEMLTRERVKPEDIWDRLSIFAALIGLVGVEWLIRRFSGLV